MRTRQWIEAVVGAVGCLGFGCVASVCGQRCGPAGQCPGDAVCIDSVDRCAPARAPNRCGYPEVVAPLQTGNDNADEPPAGPARPVEELSDARLDAPLMLATVQGVEEPSCAGGEVNLVLQATGGAAPYRWEVLSDSPPLIAAARGQSEFTLGGIIRDAGRIRVAVTDANDTTVVWSREVYERPTLSARTLSAACPHEVLRVPFRVESSSPAARSWSAQWVTAPGGARPVEALGLSFDGAALVGVLEVPLEAALIELEVVAQGEHCSSLPQRVTLPTLASWTPQCPGLAMDNYTGPTIDALPPACAGSDYVERLQFLRLDGSTVEDQAFAVQEVETPPGLTFDPETLTVQGEASTAGRLVVQWATPEHTVQETLRFAPRQKCWIGFVDAPSGGLPARLQLADARRLAYRSRETERLASARQSYPLSAGQPAVVDFQFARNGRHLAYRLRGPGRGGPLFVVDTWSGAEQALESAVTRYRWSEDSTRLAMVVSGDEGLVVREARLAEAQQWQPVPGPVIAVDALAEARSEPVWFEPNTWAILVDHEFAPFVTPLFVTPLGRSLQTVAANYPVASGARLRSGAGGVVAHNVEGTFFMPGREAVEHGAVQVSPSGHFVASAATGTVTIFPAHLSARQSEPGAGVALPGCTRLKAWSEDDQTLACFDAEAQRLALHRLVDIGTPSVTSRRLGVVEGTYSAGNAEPTALRRALSARGAWFGFAAPEGVYIVDLRNVPEDANEPLSARVMPFTALPGGLEQAELHFSPDERLLAVNWGGGATQVLDLDLRLPLDEEPTARSPQSCVEDATHNWCGVQPPVKNTQWATASDSLVHSTVTGQVVVVDLSHSSLGFSDKLTIGATCAEDCVSQGPVQVQP